ncbi:MAG: LUD domain-containing protein, partial [Duncaniella sp.]|nr:LUD domain-containing protein [Duncaniella sp.]
MSQVNQVKLGAKFIADTPHRVSHDHCLWAARMRRDSVAARIPEWEEMRSLASQIKMHTLSHLDSYLEMFEARLKENGVKVHWAIDAEEHNRIVLDIFKSHNVKVVPKGKSMRMDECDMRPLR